ncbi:hypothetical protein AEB_P2038 [Altererythrobacter sp. B11]|uniref:hypothetical protein n=1 Tax=Altererythrobacter sp. B11 TaxID=2060312 RepID=UPI000DC73743|nr:hypothetical protein [Altererythrobacter sp. B11]BBC72906.1 hypothetical protein AEB_P2038 [Altererythrobacter sp. B11]
MAVTAQPTVAQLLREEVDKLYGLTGEAEDGIRSAEHFDELEGEVTAVARRLREAFRRGRRA